MVEGPVWMSTEDAARRLGVATKTVYRFIDRGELPAYRIGRVIRLKEADVEAYEASCQIEPGAWPTSIVTDRPRRELLLRR